jgi:hypothetical protein
MGDGLASRRLVRPDRPLADGRTAIWQLVLLLVLRQSRDISDESVNRDEGNYHNLH